MKKKATKKIVLKKKSKKKKVEKNQMKSDLAVLAEMLALVVPVATDGLDFKAKCYEIRDRYGLQL